MHISNPLVSTAGWTCGQCGDWVPNGCVHLCQSTSWSRYQACPWCGTWLRDGESHQCPTYQRPYSQPANVPGSGQPTAAVVEECAGCAELRRQVAALAARVRALEIVNAALSDRNLMADALEALAASERGEGKSWGEVRREYGLEAKDKAG